MSTTLPTPPLTPLIHPLRHITLPPSATSPFTPTLDLRLPPREQRYLTLLAQTFVTPPSTPSPLALLQWRATRFFTALFRTMAGLPVAVIFSLPICEVCGAEDDESVTFEMVEWALALLEGGEEHDEGEDVTACAGEMETEEVMAAVWWLVKGRVEWMEGGRLEGWWEEKAESEGLEGEGRMEKIRGVWELAERVDEWIGVLRRVREGETREEEDWEDVEEGGKGERVYDVDDLLALAPIEDEEDYRRVF